MSTQIKTPFSDASARSSTRSRVLTPSLESSVSLHDGTNPGGRKRKRDSATMEDLLNEPFVVKPYSPTNSRRPRSFQPLLLLPRSQLPLSFLDMTFSTKALPFSRTFESHIKALELEERMGNQPAVLIARLDDPRTLFAIEREGRGRYVLCPLGSWVNLQELRGTAIAVANGLNKPSNRSSILPQESNPVPIATPESSKHNNEKCLATEPLQSMVKRPSISLIKSSHVPENEVKSQLHELERTAPVLFPGHVTDANTVPPTATEISESLRTQYFEALYLSNASLAYFVKGPLSRARAAFHLDIDSTLDLNVHIAFLESLVTSSSLLDKKYRDGIPTCISLIDIEDHSAEEATHANPKRKKRCSKKMKPGKNGLYPTEDSLIRRWWAGHDEDLDAGGPGNSKEEITKARVARLRIRETQLQMIIILEVLALQPLASATPDQPEELPTVMPTVEIAKDKTSRRKKPDHLTMLLDVHVDRLCIWQSLALESIDSPMPDSQNAAGTRTGPINQSNLTDNMLRDFCVDIIVPFFLSRLPDKCATINRKLGGPVAVSPPKPKVSKSASFSGAPSRPGAATRRPVPVKPRKSLQRVLSDDRQRRSMSRGPNKAIALLRSQTMPLMPNLKREASETPLLAGIPAAKNAHPLAISRTAVLDSKRVSSREVHINQLVPNVDAKANKQATIDAELKEAISALKKPNRELAGKAMAETAEKRSTLVSHPRKSKKPVRNPLFQGVQISATPKANRRRDITVESQHSDIFHLAERTEAPAVPSSSLPIPQSTHRSQQIRPVGTSLFSSIQATPTRRLSFPTASRLLDANFQQSEVDYGGLPPSSPLQPRRSSAHVFNAVSDSAVKRPDPFSLPNGVQETPIKKANIYSSSRGVRETPIKKKAESWINHGHPDLSGPGSDKENKNKAPGSGKSVIDAEIKDEESIYKALGWDDELDDLL